ncbi:hypothetical protein PO590_13850 [Raoultella ornithinolytica]|uniref:hypothetical protein n=1 Tax=Raoultella ornithinolytica TaxID=54291 RepID=UPI002FFCA06A
MSKDGFSADDIASTFARFASKKRDILWDESNLKRKEPEPVVFSSATTACGATILRGVASAVSKIAEHEASSKPNGWMHGTQGWGNYVNGEKMFYQGEDEC